jgi:hypothetical protein
MEGKTMRETLIQLLRKAGCGFEYRSSEEIADDLLEMGVTVQEWISVKDRLPKNNKTGEISEIVIVRTADGEVTTGWLDALEGDKWWIVIGDDDTHTCWGLEYVTHWMPLPQPPKGE